MNAPNVGFREAKRRIELGHHASLSQDELAAAFIALLARVTGQSSVPVVFVEDLEPNRAAVVRYRDVTFEADRAVKFVTLWNRVKEARDADGPGDPLTRPRAAISFWPAPAIVADLQLVIEGSDSRLAASFYYNAELFDERTMGAFSDRLSTILECINPGKIVGPIQEAGLFKAIGALTLLSPDEATRLRDAGEGSETRSPVEPVHTSI